jgi:hypothetical protein
VGWLAGGAGKYDIMYVKGSLNTTFLKHEDIVSDQSQEYQIKKALLQA